MILSSYASLALVAVLGILLARLVGPSTRGLVAGVLAWCGLLTEMGSVGIGFGLAYEIASGQDRIAVRRTTDWIMRRQIAVTIILGVVLFSLLFPARLRLLGLAYLTAVPLAFLNSYRCAEMLGNRAVTRWSLSRVAGSVVPPLLGLLFATVHRSAAAVLLGYGVGSLIGAIAASALARPPVFSDSQAHSSAAGITVDLRRRIFSYGYRTAAAGIFSASNRYIDVAAMALFLPARDVGLYAAAVSLTSLLLPIGAAFGADAFSRLPGLASTERPLLVRRSFFRSLVVLIPGTICGLAFAPFLLRITFGEAFIEAAGPARILYPAAAMLSLVDFLSSSARGEGRPMHPTVAQAAGLAVTAIGLPIALPRGGILGAAWVSLASYSLTLITLWGLLRRSRPCQLDEEHACE